MQPTRDNTLRSWIADGTALWIIHGFGSGAAFGLILMHFLR